MNSQNEDGGIINIVKNKNQIHQRPKVVNTRTDYISNKIQTTSPNSDSNLLPTEKQNKITDTGIKKEENIVKNKLGQSKPIGKYNINRISMNINQNNIKNEEIFLYLSKKNYEINAFYDQTELLYFLLSRLEKEKTLKCNILINNNSFILYSNKQKFILCAKEEFSVFHKNFLIYISRDFSETSIIAKLHSYNNKNEFILYDTGTSPSKLKNINDLNKNNLRRYLLQIKFLNNKKFDHFIVYLPKDDYFGNNNFNIDINHKDKLNEGDFNKIDVYENDLPKFDFNLHTFVNSFSNRVKEKSKFNFKIVNEGKKSIECGKVNDLNYILDISYPFSPLEAFAIALSIFIKNK